MKTRFSIPPGRSFSEGGEGGGEEGGGGGDGGGSEDDADVEFVVVDVVVVVVVIVDVLEMVGVVWVTREMQTRRSEAEMVKREGRNWRSVATTQRRRRVVRRSLSSAA